MAKIEPRTHLDDKYVYTLEKKATEIRQDLIRSLLAAGSGHSAGPLGMADVFTTLYFAALRYDPQNPSWDERDRIVLSNGHICPIWYTTLAHAGFFPISELKTLRKINSRLQGHPHVGTTPGIENTGGPLGQGLSQAVGMALAARMDKKKHWIYCLMSDGEHDEGQTWEAVLFAGKEKLSNLIGIIDRNNIQIDGFTEDVMPLEPLKEKYEAYNWHVQEVDGHNILDVFSAINEAKAVFNKPSIIIALTIPGKGVDFMERDWAWHGKPPKEDEAKKALDELRTLEGKIESEHK